jgi:toxin secretion/phage lysis holin
MKNTANTINLIFAVLGSNIGWILGGFDGFLYALVVFISIDYLTGVMAAIIEKKLSSDIGARGIFKKVMIFALVGVGNIVDVYLIKNGSAIRTAVVFFYLSNEGISILENAGKMGLPIPESLRLVLKQMNKEAKSND